MKSLPNFFRTLLVCDRMGTENERRGASVAGLEMLMVAARENQDGKREGKGAVWRQEGGSW